MSRYALNSKSPFLQQVLRSFKAHRLSEATQKTYIRWIRDYIDYHQQQHPKQLHDREVGAFITHLAADLEVGPSSQNQALSALVHLYRYVLEKPLGEHIDNLVWARKAQKLPVVYSRPEIMSFLAYLHEPFRLMTLLALCSGLRKSECCNLTLGNLDFERGVIRIENSKGGKTRETYLPTVLEESLRMAVEKARLTYRMDVERTRLPAQFPEQRLYNKPLQVVAHERDQLLFYTERYGICELSGHLVRKSISRHHLGKVMKAALAKANLEGKGSFHSLRHTFASHAYHHGANLRELQVLLGHSSVETTMIYTHLLPGGRKPVVSPIDES